MSLLDTPWYTRHRALRHQFVYAIRPAKTNYIKIGRAAEPTKRLREIQVGWPVVCDVVALIAVTADLVAQLESELHAFFRNSVSSSRAVTPCCGEWFSGVNGIIATLKIVQVHNPLFVLIAPNVVHVNDWRHIFRQGESNTAKYDAWLEGGRLRDGFERTGTGQNTLENDLELGYCDESFRHIAPLEILSVEDIAARLRIALMRVKDLKKADKLYEKWNQATFGPSTPEDEVTT